MDWDKNIEYNTVAALYNRVGWGVVRIRRVCAKTDQLPFAGAVRAEFGIKPFYRRGKFVFADTLPYRGDDFFYHLIVGVGRTAHSFYFLSVFQHFSVVHRRGS